MGGWRTGGWARHTAGAAARRVRHDAEGGRREAGEGEHDVVQRLAQRVVLRDLRRQHTTLGGGRLRKGSGVLTTVAAVWGGHRDTIRHLLPLRASAALAAGLSSTTHHNPRKRPCACPERDQN